MLELTIGKNELTSKSNMIPFEVKINSYETFGNTIDMTKVDFVAKGEYLDYNSKPSSIEVSRVVEELVNKNKYKAPIIIFNNIYIQREPTEVEKLSKEAIEKFSGTKIKEKEVLLSSTYKQIENFRSAIELLKSKKEVNRELPVVVEQIAFIAQDGTEEDFILTMEAKIISRDIAPNGNKFNIYILREWE